MRGRWWWLACAGSVIAAQMAAAQTPAPRPYGDAVEGLMVRYHAHPAIDKLGRGVGNVLCGWLELPLQIRMRYAPMDPIGTVTAGTLLGLIKSLTRTGVGVYETATFFLPLPRDFAPILPPLETFARRPAWQQPD